MKARVCVVTTVHREFDVRIYSREARTLALAGYDVSLIARHDCSETVDGIEIVALPTPRNRFSRIFGLTWRAFRLALRQRADVYHLHDPELLPIGVLLKWLRRAKVIYDVHENVPLQILTKQWVAPMLRRPIAWLFGLLEKLAARRLDAVVTATEDIATQFTRSSQVVVHNYPDQAVFPQASRREGRGNERVLVYVGGITRPRGAFEMIQALEYLDPAWNVRLELIGKFESSELEGELQALPAYRRVRFIRWLPWEDAWRQAQSAHVGLLPFCPAPNHRRALPNKLFEYMAAGLPVVASNFALWQEILEGIGCGLTVNPLDPREIAQAIEYLLAHPDEAKRMGENGRRAVLETFNWKTEGKKLLALYEELLDETR